MVGGVHLQYGQIPYPLGRQYTGWRRIILQKFSHRSKSSEPCVMHSSLGVWHEGGEESSGHGGFDGQRGLIRIVVLKKTLESPSDSSEIKAVNPKGNQPWIFFERTDVEAEAPILWPPDAKSQLTEKDPDAGKDWRQEEKGKTEDEMVGWHHWLNGHEFEQTPGDGEGQEGLACCSPWGHKELDTTEWLDNNNPWPVARLQEPALPASSPALTPGPGLPASGWAAAPKSSGPWLPSSEPVPAPGPQSFHNQPRCGQALLNISQQHAQEAEPGNQPD